MLKLSIKLEKKDLRAFVRYNLLHNYPIYFLILTFAFFIFNLSARSYPFIKKDYLISSASLIILSLILFFLYYLASIILSGTSKDKKFLEEKSYDINSDKIVVHINEAIFPLSWKEFTKIKSIKNHFFLYISHNQAIIIPKAKLSIAEKKELHQILKKAGKKIKK